MKVAVDAADDEYAATDDGMKDEMKCELAAKLQRGRIDNRSRLRSVICDGFDEEMKEFYDATILVSVRAAAPGSKFLIPIPIYVDSMTQSMGEKRC